MKKKIIAGVIFLAVISIAISAVIIYRSGDKVRAPKENDISKFEWLKMLCEETGIIEYSNDEPYFEDVTSTSEYFNYVQSAVEWDVIDDKAHFNGDDLVSGKFIALTALKTLDQSSLQRELGSEDEINEKELLRYSNYVIDNGDYYTVTGKLCCLECISTQNLYEIKDKVGTQYTSASGRVYTVQSYESYNNDQRQKCVFTCSDGETYEIDNIPAFSVDEYGRTFNSFVNENGNSVRADLNDVVINIPKKYAVAGVLSGAASGEIFEYSEIVYDIRFAEDGTVDMLEPPQTLWIQAWNEDRVKQIN